MSAVARAEAKLRAAPWLTDPRAQQIFALLPGTRAVGGAVRDTIIGRERTGPEVDFATELMPEEVMRRGDAAGIAAHPTGIAHGTVTLVLEGLVAEVTTLREDIETDGRHAVVRFGTDWAADAARRDFTLNALYAEADGTLIDPLDGLADTLAGRVRFIGDADQRIAEDRLRAYRFFRFAASHGDQQLDPEGLAAVKRAAGTLSTLSAERVGAEMKRILSLPKSAVVLRAMADAGMPVLASDKALDLLDRLETLDAAPTFGQRLALLIEGGAAAEDVQAAWRLSREEFRTMGSIGAATATLVDGGLYRAAYLQPERVIEAVSVAGAIAQWSRERVRRLKSELSAIVPLGLPLDGNDLIAAGWPSGPALAQELERLSTLWTDSGSQMTREELLAAIRPYRG